MSLNIEAGEIAAAVKMVKKECERVKEMSAYEINKLALQIVVASNMYDSASLISESIDVLTES
jgi:signal transduction protein with GAF and PtsI domain